MLPWKKAFNGTRALNQIIAVQSAPWILPHRSTAEVITPEIKWFSVYLAAYWHWTKPDWNLQKAEKEAVEIRGCDLF